jgi:hypothetical protein
VSTRLGPEPIDFEIRPRFGSFVGRFGARVASGGAVALLLLAIEVVRMAMSPGGLKKAAAGWLILVLILAVTAAAYGIRARIVVAGETVIQNGWRNRRFLRSDVTGVVACMTGFNRNNRLLALKGIHNECLLCLYADFWSETDLEHFLIRLGQPVPNSYEGACSPAMLRHLFPGKGLPLAVARPALLGLMLSPIIVVVIVVLVQLTSG